jgi:hypothetical protein
MQVGLQNEFRSSHLRPGVGMLLKFLSAKFPMIHTPKPLSDSCKGSGDKKKTETEYLT